MRHRHDGDGRSPAASSARRCANRLAAASIRSPRAERLSTCAACAAPAASCRAEGQQRLAGGDARRVEAQPRARRVVRGQLARRHRRVVCRSAPASASGRPSTRSMSPRARAPGRSSAGSPRQATMVDSSPIGRRSAVDDQFDAPAQVGQHVRRRGRRDVAGPIRRRRHHRPAERRQQVLRHRMVGHPQRDAVEPGGGEVGDRAAGSLRHHQRQRSRPECLREPLGGRGRIGPARAPPPRPATCAISGLKDGRPFAS